MNLIEPSRSRLGDVYLDVRGRIRDKAGPTVNQYKIMQSLGSCQSDPHFSSGVTLSVAGEKILQNREAYGLEEVIETLENGGRAVNATTQRTIEASLQFLQIQPVSRSDPLRRDTKAA